jgi:group II intron reverse transcriptase/maturase
MSTQLSQIAKKARLDRKARFTSLAHLLTPEFLKETWGKMNRRASGGVDGLSAKQFERELGTQIEAICAQLKAGSYRAPPVRRVEIPKGPGKVGTRPLGIPTVADRLLQRAVARILEAVFEADFLECSHGFRPGRNPHHALQALRVQIVTKKVMQVFEADIRSYFTRINRQWLRKMVAHRIADPVILSLIGKWLNAGAMKDGVVIYAEEGTPQGGPISPVLSNVYLHFLLDLWFEKKIKPACRGEAYLVRFADDFVATFQYREDVDGFQTKVRERFAEFGLELAEEKTRRILFGRFAASTRQRYGQGRPETFEFLGFKHVSGTDRSGHFALIRIPSAKSCRKFLLRTREWIFEHRHWRRWEQQQHLTKMLRGFYQYFALHHCERKLSWVRQQVQRQWIGALNRRGQRRKTNWMRLKACPWFELPWAQHPHPMV